jgi:subfamily B ATP-binding cassette protein MsbA
LKDYALQNLRSHIGVVSQDIILFDDTVKNNILFGKPASTNEEIIGAAKAAYAHEFIMNMPNGYDTIGERGVKLSGAKAENISRPCYHKNPKILILDEATSSSTWTETKIQKARRHDAGRTTIIIALGSQPSRRRTDCGHGQGKIIQQGSHDELFEKGGVYRTVCDAVRLTSSQ